MKKRMNFQVTHEAPTVPVMRVPRQEPEQATRPVLRQRQQATEIAPVAGLMAVISDWRKVAMAAFAIGTFFGLVVLGWYVWPVEWTDAPISELRTEDKLLILEMAQDLHAFDPESPKIHELTLRWDEVAAGACFLVEQEQDPVKKVQLYSLAYKASDGRGCLDQ